VLAVWTVACAPRITVEPLAPLQRPANTGQVDVWAQAEDISRPYQKIALLTAADHPSARRLDSDVVQALAARAGRLGADGLLLGSRHTRRQRIPTGMGGSVQSVMDYVSAYAIVYTD
jgi:hypothetical protein